MEPHINNTNTDIEPKLIQKTSIDHELGIWFLITLMLLIIIGNTGLYMMNIDLDEHSDRKYFIPIWIGTMAFCLISFLCTKMTKAETKTTDISSKKLKLIGISIAIICCFSNIAILAYDWNTCAKIEIQKESIIQAKMTEIDDVFVSHKGRTHHLSVHAGQPTNVRGYPDENGYDMYASYDITPDGKINAITYCIKVKKSLTKENALTQMQRKYRTLRKFSSEIIMDKKFKKKYSLPTEFQQDFLKDKTWIPLLESDDEDSDPKHYEIQNTDNIAADAYFEIDDVEKVGILWINITEKNKNNIS